MGVPPIDGPGPRRLSTLYGHWAAGEMGGTGFSCLPSAFALGGFLLKQPRRHAVVFLEPTIFMHRLNMGAEPWLTGLRHEQMSTCSYLQVHPRHVGPVHPQKERVTPMGPWLFCRVLWGLVFLGLGPVAIVQVT